MKKVNPIYYFYPALLLFVILLSLFLNAEIFKSPLQTFSAWFILSVFAFSIGWAIDKFFGWRQGAKVLFVTIIVAVFFTVIVSAFFHEYFYISNPFLEDLLFFGLRGVTLGAMGYFGMAVSQTVRKETLCEFKEEVEKVSETKLKNAEEKAQLIIDKAEVEADKILSKAKADAEKFSRQKEELERSIRKLINAEKELLSKYENEK